MNASLPSSQRSERLLLRRPEEADLDFLIDLFSRRELVAHRPDPVPDTAQQSVARLTRDIGHWDKHGFGRLAVEADEKLVGFGGVTVSADFDGLNLSYHLHPASWGHGYATELVTEALRTAFGPLRADRVVGLVRPANPASRRVLEKCGFVFEKEVMLHGAPTIVLALAHPRRVNISGPAA
ncbi:N-acetyltransferase [Mesorhizobium sp. WSM1497]|uniref:GNAT family N-acetyltransferase n=1 Tax=Mesorhizobium sp. WSM1497 TaxID=278153 RepID=UPI0007EDA155|nr:GNAT family N-acetyltransferase [Mesorhizobium sp. WSM1497]ARP66711.1 N-acetyltransferase [Mesorhizobium sp. WSM1497]